MLIAARFLYFYATDNGEGHVQSLILASLALILAALAGLCGLLADLIATNRKLLEQILSQARRKT